MRDDPGLDRVAEFCRAGLIRTGVHGMTVTYGHAAGQLELLVATDDLVERVAQLEFAIGQGPSVDAVTSGLPVAADDLRGDGASPWPLFATEATHAGIGAVHAFPIVFDHRAFGVVALYSRTPHRLTTTQHHQAEDIAGLIGLALIDPDAGEAVGSALRMTVHQAAGMVMQQMGVSIHEALVVLRSTAFAEDVPVTDLAAEVIARRRRFGEEQTVDD
jgi:hypothetical protein